MFLLSRDAGGEAAKHQQSRGGGGEEEGGGVKGNGTSDRITQTKFQLHQHAVRNSFIVDCFCVPILISRLNM